MGTDIHPSAVVSPKAKIADGVCIGPFSIIGEKVEIGRDTVIDSHVVIDGHTVIGERNRIYPYVSLGLPPQDVGYSGEDTRLEIGDGNVIREFVTVNRATTKQDWATRMETTTSSWHMLTLPTTAHSGIPLSCRMLQPWAGT